MCAVQGCKVASGESYHCELHAELNAQRVAKHRKLRRQRENAGVPRAGRR